MKCCTFEGCDAAVKAKSLCSTHCLRLRRTGDTGTVGKPDRKRGGFKSTLRNLFVDRSDRTFERYYAALVNLDEIEGKDGFKAAVSRCTRPSGSVNVSALEREATQAIVRHVDTMHSQKGEK